GRTALAAAAVTVRAVTVRTVAVRAVAVRMGRGGGTERENQWSLT
ncbi:MAG: hypothetical protein QOG96_5666, partial [Pseudonocardiales bacterium]|nr:hypothetical protein [Pseudonocardiales bacterium]